MDSTTSERSTLPPPPSSRPLSQYPRANLNGNQDANKPRPSHSRRGDTVAVGLHSHFSDPASTVNVRDSESISVNDSSVALIARQHSVPPPPVRKLRKKPPGKDEDESAGGYTSSEKKPTKKEKSGDSLDLKLKTKNSIIQVINRISNELHSPSQGYETDGSAILSPQKSTTKPKKKSKTKNSSKDLGYDTDGGYQSENKKSKKRFFKLSPKSSKPEFQVPPIEPVPALPTFVEKKRELPIAGKFARTRAFSFSIPSPTTTESADSNADNPFPQISFRPFPSTNNVSTTSSSSPVSVKRSSILDRAKIAPLSDSPSAFSTPLPPKKRDSRFSSTTSSSSSGSGSNQHNKLNSHLSPFHSPPSSLEGPPLRPTLSLSALKHPKPVISVPLIRDISPSSTNPPSTKSVHSLSVSPVSTSSASSLQSKKPFRIKIHHPDLPTQLPSPEKTVPAAPSEPGSRSAFLTTPKHPLPQIPRIAVKVRPKNPPTDGFGPRSSISSITSDSATLGSTLRPTPISTPMPSPGLSPHTPTANVQASSKRSSQQTIIPSSDYIVPSPRGSPMKSQYSGPPSPTVFAATYQHHDRIPPQPSPAPKGPLPSPPSSSESLARVAGNNNSNTRNGVAALRVGKKKSGSGSSGDDVPKLQKERLEKASLSRFAAVKRDLWFDNDDGDTSLDAPKGKKDDKQEVEEPDELYDILNRFDSRDSSLSLGQGSERSRSSKSSKASKEHQGYYYPDTIFDATRPQPRQYLPVALVAPDLYGLEADDGKSLTDRTSRWSESVYSRSSSILDEEESEERRGRFLKRVEAMLDAEKSKAQAYIPPLPTIPHAYANVVHKSNGSINENAGRSNMTTTNISIPITTTTTTTPAGRSWNKF